MTGHNAPQGTASGGGENSGIRRGEAAVEEIGSQRKGGDNGGAVEEIGRGVEPRQLGKYY